MATMMTTSVVLVVVLLLLPLLLLPVHQHAVLSAPHTVASKLPLEIAQSKGEIDWVPTSRTCP